MDFLIFQVPMLTLQAVLDGLLLGILFALIAYGMALQWGVMNIINIAQGDLVILGGYIAYFMYRYIKYAMYPPNITKSPCAILIMFITPH